MTKALRVALVGAGITSRHLIGYRWRPQLFELKVLCSLDPRAGPPAVRGIRHSRIHRELRFAAVARRHRRHRHRDAALPAFRHGETRHPRRQARDLREAAVRLGGRGRRDAADRRRYRSPADAGPPVPLRHGPAEAEAPGRRGARRKALHDDDRDALVAHRRVLQGAVARKMGDRARRRLPRPRHPRPRHAQLHPRRRRARCSPTAPR